MIPGLSLLLSKTVATLTESFMHFSGKSAEEAKEIGFAAGVGAGSLVAVIDPIGGALVLASAYNHDQKYKGPKP